MERKENDHRPIKLSEQYLTGISAIDYQHSELLHVLDVTLECIKNSSGVEKPIARIFAELKDYTDYHFQYEEKMMEECGYPEKELHKTMHQNFISKLKLLEKDIFSKKEIRMKNTATFVRDWLLQHIAVEDKKIALYIKNNFQQAA